MENGNLKILLYNLKPLHVGQEQRYVMDITDRPSEKSFFYRPRNRNLQSIKRRMYMTLVPMERAVRNYRQG